MVTRVTDLRNQGDYRSLDDRMLVLDFQAGQPEAFVEIHRRYGPLARHVCQRFLQNAADVDEAFQETMIRVFQGLHRFNGRYALQPWVARIATNVSLDQIRTRARRPQLEDGTIEDHDHGDPADGPEELIERLVERDLVLQVLAGLPPTHRAALVLRELEGQSHREIAEALDITPAQAKALIHRAKGSFRRGWLVAITDKGGLTGIALLPLLWAARALDGVRKVVDRIGGHAVQVAQAATPEVVSSAASSPTAVTAASSITERVVAAGVTLLLAGGVTVGAATIVKQRADRDAGDRVAATASPAASPATAPEPETSDAALAPRSHPDRAKDEGKPDRASDVEGPVAVPPIVETSPSPEPSPTGDPSPTPSPTPTETIVPAPPWSFAFVVASRSDETCECDGTTKVIASRLEPTDDGGFKFSHTITGGAFDSAGDATWPFYLTQGGVIGPADPSGGSLRYTFVLFSAEGTQLLYQGAAALNEAVANDDGSTTYRFEGTFLLQTPDDTPTDLPSSGFVTATIGVWSDGTIYAGSFSLSEASAG